MKKIVGLDSLRFFAFIAIFLYHIDSKFGLGYLGADFFFVLSSFLLSLLALNEIEKTNNFNAFNFFIRRSLKVFPLYFFVVGLSFLLLPFISKTLNTPISLPEHQWMYWTFLSNYETTDSIFALKFLWTVAVEEQFYLSFILLSFLFKKHFWAPIIVFLSIYLIFMIYAQINDSSTHTHALTHFSNFSIGMLTAYFYKKKWLLKTAIVCFIISAITLFFVDTPKIIFHLLSSILFASIIIITIESIQRFKLQKLFYPSEFLGQYTYGLYLYSGFILTFGTKFIPINNKPLLTIIELLLLVIISLVSYHLFERKFLKLKKHFR